MGNSSVKRQGDREKPPPAARFGGFSVGGEKEMAKEGGEMTVRDAGRKGGEIRKRELGSEGYSELGKKGGSRVRELIRKGKEAEQQTSK